MRVKILEESIKHDIDGVLQTFEKDDVRGVPDSVGEYFCSMGWAEDVSGNIPTGERDVNKRASIAVDNVKASVEVTNG